MDLGQYATLRAMLDAGTDLGEALAGTGIEEHAWRAIDEEWQIRIASAAANEDFDLTRQFNAAFAAARRRMGLRAEAVDDPPGPFDAQAPRREGQPPGDPALCPDEPAPETLSSEELIATAHVLPFVGGGTSERSHRTAQRPPDPRPVLPFRSPPARSDLRSTAEMPSVQPAPVLPFGTTESLGAGSEPMRPFETAGKPADMRHTTEMPSIERGPALPFTSRLRLEQLASLSVELAGGNAVAVLRRYHLDESEWTTEQGVWEQRFERDPELRQRFHALRNTHANSLRKRRG